MSTTIKTAFALRKASQYMLDIKPGLDVGLKVIATGYHRLSDTDSARIVSVAVEAFEVALRVEFERVTTEGDKESSEEGE